MSGTRHSDTHVEYVLDTETWLGPYEDTPFAVVREAAALIASAGLHVEALPDLLPAQWSKLIFNADRQRGRGADRTCRTTGTSRRASTRPISAISSTT